MINAQTQLYGVIGFPVKHSLSPVFQNALIRYAGLNAVYLAFEINPEELKKAFEGFKALKVKGINVTVPFKEEIIPLLDYVEDTAKEIGAVNTVKFENGKAYGYNTDWIGFLKSLKSLIPEVKEKSILVLGAGGASRAVIYALVKEGAKVFLWNRTKEKAIKLAQKFPLEVVNSPEEVIDKVQVIVNTTSVGLKDEDPEIFNYDLIKKDHVVVDIIYKETKLLKKAKEKGAKTLDGLPMLLWQGIEAFKIWNGCEVPYSVAERSVRDLRG